MAEAFVQQHAVDPSPRTYPPMVSLLRRSVFDPSGLSVSGVQDVENWLLDEAGQIQDTLLLVEAFFWRMCASGLPVDRAMISVGTLHPQLAGYAWNWNADDGFCDEVKVADASLDTDAFRANPLFRVINHGEEIRVWMDPEKEDQGSPLLNELAAVGYTEYAALPIPTTSRLHNAATFATRQEGGFEEAQVDLIKTLFRFFALHMEQHGTRMIAENIVSTYLGEAAGQQVLTGSIKRGAGAEIDAIIWASDLRGFTDLADRLDDEAVTAVLNAYFDRLAGAVMDHGGDVLKYIGDGLLAVFPFDHFETETRAAEAALAAARQALGDLDALNGDPEILQGLEGWRPLRSGIALHRGSVFFGNVGSPRRLDFTVIGRAVNAASRVESLSKDLAHPLLVTDPVARLLSDPLEDFGLHSLRGLSEPVRIFGG